MHVNSEFPLRTFAIAPRSGDHRHVISAFGESFDDSEAGARPNTGDERDFFAHGCYLLIRIDDPRSHEFHTIITKKHIISDKEGRHSEHAAIGSLLIVLGEQFADLAVGGGLPKLLCVDTASAKKALATGLACQVGVAGPNRFEQSFMGAVMDTELLGC
jgi:hypothetical protein